MKKNAYQKITDSIREMIDKGDLKPGDKIPSVSSIKAKYSVSQITALRVFKELVSSNHIIKKEGQGYYVRNQYAKKNFLKKEYKHGFIANFVRSLCPDNPDDIYFNRINYGIQSEILRKGYNQIQPYSTQFLNMLPPSSRSLEELKESIIDLGEIVDGYILDDRIPDELLVDVLDNLKAPMVIINRIPDLPIDSVTPSYQDIAEKTVEMILKMGYDYFVLSSGKRFFDRLDRSKYYEDVLKGNSINSGSIQIEACIQPEMDKTVQKYISIYEKYKGSKKVIFFALDDYQAKDICDGFLAQGITPGKDVGVMGFGGVKFCSLSEPEISTINTMPEQLGVKAVDVLFSKMNKSNAGTDKFINHNTEFSLSFGKTI